MKTNSSLPKEMRAAAIDRFGGPEVLTMHSLPVPKPKSHEVEIQLDTCGVGVWDPEVRTGDLKFGPTRFPLVMGNDGAGTVVSTGIDVSRFRVGDRVYGYAMQGGFYAEYVTVKEDNVAAIPPGLDMHEAGALGADGITALRGLDDQLHLRAGEKLMIFGASGGIGHIAVQLAKRIGADVLAVASGRDGVDLVTRLGADSAVNGHEDDIVAAAREFAPDGLDCALVLVGNDKLSDVLAMMKQGGRVAHPNGVEPVPGAPEGVKVLAYDGEPGRDAFERLNGLIGSKPFHVELGHVYPLDEAARAHRAVGEHHLGKLALRIGADQGVLS
ncbi:MAG TPA: NADP-dependent oxidoreductase [Opitutus sp.]|nr:NADP-dependent oxidoreductase [Opitutus sp.]